MPTSNADRLLPYTRIDSAWGLTTRSSGNLRNSVSKTWSVSAKRPKPQGIGILFAPTSWSAGSAIVEDRVGTVVNTVSRYNSIKREWEYSSRQRTVSNYDSTGIGLPTQVLSEVPSTSKLLLKIKDEKVNLAMMLAEYRQSGQMFVDLTKSLWNVYRGVRKGNLAPLLAQGVKSAPSTWLMYRYGLTPLIADATAIVDLMNSSKAFPLVQRYAVKTDYRRMTASVRKFSDGGVTGPFREYETRRVKDLAYVEYSHDLLAKLPTQLGFTNLPQLVWEVIPFSFVVDWFINIGDTLASLDALTGSKRHVAVRIQKGTIHTSLPFGAKGSRWYYNRNLLNLTVGMPAYEPSLTYKRIVDALALTRQRMGKR